MRVMLELARIPVEAQAGSILGAEHPNVLVRADRDQLEPIPLIDVFDRAKFILDTRQLGGGTVVLEHLLELPFGQAVSRLGL